MKFIKRLIAKHKHKKVCKANGYFCPECIYHNFIFDKDMTFRGNRCKEPNSV